MSLYRLAWVGLLAAAGCAVPPSSAAADAAPLPAIRVGAVELHYDARGKGEPVVFVHGSLVDYTEWGPVAQLLESRYRTITYSRRYNFPNTNALSASDHSALVESQDLAGLIEGLKLGPVHLVGASYGAYTALLTTLRRTDLVRSLTVVEPPLLKWVPALPGGEALSDDFFAMWTAARAAFARDDPAAALRVTLEWFVGADGIAQLTADDMAVLERNLLEWRALARSSDAFPAVSAEEVRAIKVPVLMISGGRTYPILELVDGELEKRLAHGKRIVVGDGTHDVCSEQPAVCAEAIRAFLAP